MIISASDFNLLRAAFGSILICFGKQYSLGTHHAVNTHFTLFMIFATYNCRLVKILPFILIRLQIIILNKNHTGLKIQQQPNKNTARLITGIKNKYRCTFGEY